MLKTGLLTIKKHQTCKFLRKSAAVDDEFKRGSVVIKIKLRFSDSIKNLSDEIKTVNSFNLFWHIYD